MRIDCNRLRIMPHKPRVPSLEGWWQVECLPADILSVTFSEGIRKPLSRVVPIFKCKHWHIKCRGRRKLHSFHSWKHDLQIVEDDRSHNWNAQLLFLTVGIPKYALVWKGHSPHRRSLPLSLKMSIRFRFNTRLLIRVRYRKIYKALSKYKVYLQVNLV